MKRIGKFYIKYCKLFISSVFFFCLGCMFVINLVPINRTCRLDDTDREYSTLQNSKIKNPDLIVLIISAPNNQDKRTVIRDTWLKFGGKFQTTDANNSFLRHFFVIGSLGLSADNILHLSSEQSRFNDMLILPMYDGYANLTRKVLGSFIWLNDQLDIGLDFKYVLKCDDDSFVRLDSLAHEIKQIEIMYLKSDLQDVDVIDNTSPFLRVNVQINSKSPTNQMQLYWGYFNGRAHVKTSGKWKEDGWILCDHYIPYALGGGYILSKGLVTFLARNAEYLRYYKSEDVSVGTWLSPVNNVIRIHDRRFDTEWTTRGCQNYYIISHNLAAKVMYAMYGSILRTGYMCESEATKRPYYLYNWNVPPSKCCHNNM